MYVKIVIIMEYVEGGIFLLLTEMDIGEKIFIHMIFLNVL